METALHNAKLETRGIMKPKKSYGLQTGQTQSSL